MARIARLNSSENSRQLKICSNKAKAHNEGKTPILINTDQLVAFNVICHDIGYCSYENEENELWRRIIETSGELFEREDK